MALGGHWVGGTLYLTEDYVEFHPNTINKAVHKDPEALNVFLPLVGCDASDADKENCNRGRGGFDRLHEGVW